MSPQLDASWTQPPRPRGPFVETRKFASSSRQPTPKSPTDLSKLSYERRTCIDRPPTPTERSW